MISQEVILGVFQLVSVCLEVGWELLLTKLKQHFNKKNQPGSCVFGKTHSRLFLCTSSPPHPSDPKTLPQVISTDSVFTSIFFVIVCCLIIINVITLKSYLFAALALHTIVELTQIQ